ncbi:MAG: type II secretion system protein [Ruminococcus sp.]|nr:type II secretion system protein [Ruminococcus sp.]
MHNKRKLKGFTLIELLIVVSIFGVIMTLVMSLIDPVAKIMSKTSVRERTAAYADNISEYIDNSLHYAEFMRVYNGALCKPMHNESEEDNLEVEINEEEAIRLFIDDVLDGAVAPDPTDAKKPVPLKGRVRLMKFINTDGNALGLEPGQIYETVYEFTCADKVTESDGTVTELSGVKISVTDADGNPIPGCYMNRPLINEEHYEDYNYYFKTGFYTLDPLKDPENYYATDGSSKSYASANRSYYSRLYPMLYAKDADELVDDPIEIQAGRNFSMNIVSYRQDDDVDHKEDVLYEGVDPAEFMPVFKSPAHLSAATMALTNVVNANSASEVRYVKKERNDTGDLVYTPVMGGSAKLAYTEYTPRLDEDRITDDIYIIYIMPEEIFDTNITYD